ncbi:MAG TPA: hypothetical protein VGF71_18775 [Caulobacteraceae bacterium]
MKKLIAAAMFAAGLAFSTGALAADPPKPLSTDTPIQDIVANPDGKAVLDKDMPGLTSHAMYDQFKTMSLKDLQPMSQGAITDDQLKKVADDLAKVKPQ